MCEIKKTKQRDIPGGNWLGVRAKIVEWCGRLCKYWLDHRAITGVKDEKNVLNWYSYWLDMRAIIYLGEWVEEGYIIVMG